MSRPCRTTPCIQPCCNSRHDSVSSSPNQAVAAAVLVTLNRQFSPLNSPVGCYIPDILVLVSGAAKPRSPTSICICKSPASLTKKQNHRTEYEVKQRGCSSCGVTGDLEMSRVELRRKNYAWLVTWLKGRLANAKS